MKRNICLLLVLIFAMLFLAGCGVKSSSTLSGNVTIQEWIDKKGEGDDFTVTVKVVEFLNPVYARVEDSSGSVLLFGLWEDGEPKTFAEKEIDLGDTIVVKNPIYNVYEGEVEMKEGTLVENN